MMTCAQLRPILSFVIEKETGPAETLAARRHLDACHACRARAAGLSRVMEGCAGLTVSKPPTDVATGVMSRLRSMRAADPRLTASARFTKWGGLAVLLFAGLCAMARPGGHPFGELLRPLGSVLETARAASAEKLSDSVTSAAPIVVDLMGGGTGPELSSSAGIDVHVIIQVLATALTIGFMLAIPAIVMTAWMIRSRRPGSLSST